MALILNIETSTKNCSVSLSENGELIAIKELNDGNYSHAEKLHVFIQEVLDVTNKSFSDLEAVAVSKGPGSYTGLRIGVSAAKGLCFALDIPLISVNTLQGLAMQVQTENGYIIPMLDARRMEVYSAIFDVNFNAIREVQAQVLDEFSFERYLIEKPVYFIGDGVAKTKELIKNSNANFIQHKFPSAREMASISNAKYLENQFEDVAYFEPYYLKDFLVTPSKKKV
ncbi:tRNA (adenosine(37)-N6)-threonylcarbamoyltransferase complex dimerization subunit type 1 TsaB [Urechidicola vernalis]|uniref:tRNA (Adenosine(37)-N6)-threonylcarbamoyltransferase complex dimerization subunit type 1 TsaB n=1 Tax=Urechidicola vernalis TaxID=3075600 RepID=A0ABU2Y784_9FLAO|nr:tRNA (adenosine(37)-N6)-threonylcarbamoyltransferase complex dimerization subunit type 1 TsaB [Urechidicola sp. P050]MDT0554059.1 tRNA (adenosine(37)-N6)-threonylcarbamoyltransferase complex dimerization subunit type 1 TsaB [Urechidicola sp. P050]